MRGVTLAMAMAIPMLAAPAFAAENSDADDSAAKEGEEAQSDDEGVQLRVPADLRGQGYQLRVGGTRYPVEGDKLDLPSNQARADVVLADSHGRVVAITDSYYDDDLLRNELRPRRFRAGAAFGGAVMQDADFKQLAQTRHLREASLDGKWQPGPIGLALTYAHLAARRESPAKLTTDFEEWQLRAAVLYELAPLQWLRSPLERLHLNLLAGAFAATSKIEIGDTVTNASDHSRWNGMYAAADVLYPIYDFWLSVRVYVSTGELRFRKLGYKGSAARQAALFGGAYAF